MGLFDGLKKKASDPVPEATVEPVGKPDLDTVMVKWHWPEKDSNEETVVIADYVNLTEKNVKVEVPEEEGLYVKGVYLWEEDGLIRGLNGDDVIFEVTKRSKAYRELEQYLRHRAKSVTLYKRTGDYGPYYRTLIKFDVVRDD